MHGQVVEGALIRVMTGLDILAYHYKIWSRTGMERTVRTLMINEVKINPNDEDCLDTLNIVDKAIVTRSSTRAFLSTPVEHRLIKQILSVASNPPLGASPATFDKVSGFLGDHHC